MTAQRSPAPKRIASSTSGLLPSELQAGLRRPDRFLVSHPFNPVYLLPLVEVVAGERTSEDTVARAASFYESLGMRPLRVRTEIDGFVADRLLEALWREALWLVHDDIATVEEIDDLVVRTGHPRAAFRTLIEHAELDPTQVVVGRTVGDVGSAVAGTAWRPVVGSLLQPWRCLNGKAPLSSVRTSQA